MPTLSTIRKLDDAGRIVLPASLRVSLEIDAQDSLEIFTKGELIIFRKYLPGCIFCHQMKNLKVINDKKLCKSCIREILRSSQQCRNL